MSPERSSSNFPLPPIELAWDMAHAEKSMRDSIISKRERFRANLFYPNDPNDPNWEDKYPEFDREVDANYLGRALEESNQIEAYYYVKLAQRDKHYFEVE